MFCKKAPEKPCCLAAFSPHLDMMVVVVVILVWLLYLATLVDVGDHVVGDHVVGDDYLHDSVMFTKSVMLQPRSMASQTMNAAESPNTTYKVADGFFVQLIEHQQNELLQKRIAIAIGFKMLRFGNSRMYRG